MITIDDLADLEQAREANPTETIRFVKQDGTELLHCPDQDDRPVVRPAGWSYVPRYTNK